MIEAVLQLPRDVLWKYGGHPAVQHSKAAYDATEKLRSALAGLEAAPVFAVSEGVEEAAAAAPSAVSSGGLLQLSGMLKRSDLLSSPHRKRLLGLAGSIAAASAAVAKSPTASASSLSAVLSQSSTQAVESTLKAIAACLPSDPLGPALPHPDYIADPSTPTSSSFGAADALEFYAGGQVDTVEHLVRVCGAFLNVVEPAEGLRLDSWFRFRGA